MADNGSRAIRHPPPPPSQKMAGEKKALVVPPPPPAARRASGNMPAVSQPKEGPFLWKKPAPEQPQPQKPGTLREAIGEGTHKALAATIIKLCRACNLDKGQFTADSSSVIFRSQGTSKVLRMPVEFVEGKPEILAQYVKREPAIAPGRRYLLIYSSRWGRLAGPFGEAAEGEGPQAAIRRIAMAQLALMDSEIAGIFSFPAPSLSESTVSFFSLALPYHRLLGIVEGINKANPAQHLGLNDFFFAALARRPHFIVESMSGAYMAEFGSILESLESIRRPA